jgi:phosphatidylglycerophosphatase A
MVSLIATGLGAGFSPKAPGTAGTVVGLLLAYGIREWSSLAQVLVFAVLFFAGWWATWEWSRNTRQSDSQRIVIDEILGYLVAICLLPKVHLVLWVQFGLFRLFDAAKPPPIRQVDRYGKRFEIGLLQSLFVILDDLLAGGVALGLGWALFRMFGAEFGVDIPHP